MGSKSGYRCRGCGYEAIVSGGPDIGMVIRTQTMTCLDCRELVDVITGFHFENERDDDIGRCPKCKGRRLKEWGEGRTGHHEFGEDAPGPWIDENLGPRPSGPCPRCGDIMDLIGWVEDWD